MTKIKNIQKRKITHKTQKALHRLEVFFLQNRKKANICVITFEPIQICLIPQNDCLNLSFVKK